MRQEPDQETDRLATAVIGAAIEVHRILGPGYLESIYEGALAVELELRGVPFERQKPVCVAYTGAYAGFERRTGAAQNGHDGDELLGAGA
ncbi:MAG: GxxExxY protein [Kiritimatiellia bacterium]